MIQVAVYCGIDVGLKSHVVCLLDEAQKIIKRYSIGNDIHGFRKLEDDLDTHTKLCLEPTGVYSVNIYLHFRNRGYNVRFCQTKSSHDFRKSMFSSKKHDRLDSFALAKYRIVHEDKTFDGARLLERLGTDAPQASFDPEYQALSELVTQYLSVKKWRARLHNKITSLVDLRFPEAIHVFPSDRSCKTIRAALLHPKEDILSGRLKLHRLTKIQDKLRESIGQYDMKQLDFRIHVEELNALESRIKQLEAAIKDKLYKMGYGFLFEYYCLSTIGISILVKEVRDIKRFYRYSANGKLNKKRSLRAFREFLGMIVSLKQSGVKDGGHTLSKSGNMTLRNILFLMAMHYVKASPSKPVNNTASELDPVKLKARYEALVAKGMRRIAALTRIMNKIATDLFFIFKAHADARMAPAQA